MDNKKVLIVLSIYGTRGVDTHTQILQKELNADICYKEISNDNTQKKYYPDITDNYDIVIWQSPWVKIEKKLNHQTYYFFIHSDPKIWNNICRENIIYNRKYVDSFIFVSQQTKDSFENIIGKQENSLVFENKLEKIEKIDNDKKEITGLFVCGGAYSRLKGHNKLIEKFEKLDSNIYTLEIYGEIQDRKYYDTLKNYITRKNIKNIKLYEYTKQYIERLKEAEYFILLSRSEACSYAIIEAIILNKKIICSKECVTFSEIQNYPNKYITENNNDTHEWIKLEKINYTPKYYIFGEYKDLLLKTEQIKKIQIHTNKDFIFKLSEEKKTINIFSANNKNDKNQPIKEYHFFSVSDIKFTIDNVNNTIWLFVCDNFNLKLFACVNNIWEKNYRILYHNEFKITKIETNNYDFSTVILFDEKNNAKKLKINEEMYRMDIII
jgi:hypothetical protein